MESRLEGALQQQLERWQLFAPCLGANATVAVSGLGRWNGASGLADADTKDPMPVDGSFYIYSITKTFTAIRVLQLAEQGDLSLDDPVTVYLPTLTFPPTVTVRTLLNHTAGVPSYTDLPAYLPSVREKPSTPWSYDEVLKFTGSGKLDFAPGEGWHYSNTGYMLLAAVIEAVTGKSYARNIEDDIVRPLGLVRTYAALDVDKGNVVPGYCRYLNAAEAMENVIPRYHPGWCKTGLIVSTTAEVAEIYTALFDGRLLKPESVRAMAAWTGIGAGPVFFRKAGYGLGLMLDPDWGFGGVHGHGGDGPGANTWAMYLPDFHGRRLALAVFCNTTLAPHPYYLVKDLLRALGDALQMQSGSST